MAVEDNLTTSRGNPASGINLSNNFFTELERNVYSALSTYSNVHRGSGHSSLITTHLYEHAREIVLEYLGLKKGKFVVIFCTPLRAATLSSQLSAGSFQSVSSHEIGLPVGVTALAVKRKRLPGGAPFQTGGGTTILVSQDSVIWAGAPDRFEAGTPAIINVIAFSRALQLIRRHGNDIFMQKDTNRIVPSELFHNDELSDYSGLELLEKLRKTMVGRNNIVPTAEGPRPYIHLDNSASTQSLELVWNTFCLAWRQPDLVLPELINEARSICAGMVDAPLTGYEILFTSNTTESINLAAANYNWDKEPDTESVVLTTILEHTSNDLPWRNVSNTSVIRMQVDDDGFINLNELESILSEYNQKRVYGKKRVRLMTVSGASNVLGVVNDLAGISRIVHKYGALLFVDAAQLIAHRKVCVALDGIDLLAFSAHKVYAPFGTGVLVARKGVLNLGPCQYDAIKSSGEQNSAGIVALGKALVLLQRIGMDVIKKEEQALTGQLLHGMKKIKGLKIYGIKDPDSPFFTQKGGVVVFSLDGAMANRVAKELAVRSGIGIRSGCHCAHLLIKQLVGVGPGLARFQRFIATLFPAIKFPGLARVSLGIGNNEEDVEIFIREVEKIALHTEAGENKEIEQEITNLKREAIINVFSG